MILMTMIKILHLLVHLLLASIAKLANHLLLKTLPETMLTLEEIFVKVLIGVKM